MVFFPDWALNRLTYWMMFALMVLCIEKLGRNMNLKIFRIGPRLDKIIMILTILGIVLLFLWVLFHP
jgi:hypothetical protein